MILSTESPVMSFRAIDAIPRERCVDAVSCETETTPGTPKRDFIGPPLPSSLPEAAFRTDKPDRPPHATQLRLGPGPQLGDCGSLRAPNATHLPAPPAQHLGCSSAIVIVKTQLVRRCGDVFACAQLAGRRGQFSDPHGHPQLAGRPPPR
eukprot:scaffold5321_cov267-Pinguiococcus_pyrenoidosus.AAC.3